MTINPATNRRNVVLGLTAVALAPTLSAQAPKTPLKTLRLNNIMIAVSNLDRSIGFYQKLFGPPVRQGDVALFRLSPGPHFFALVSAQAGAKADYLSYGMTVENFDADRVKETLAAFGVAAQTATRDGTPELFMPDPDGIKIQLQHAAYGRGSGPRGDQLPPAPKPLIAPPFSLKSISHVTLTTTNVARSGDFYKSLFAMPVQTTQGGGPILAVGSGPDCVVIGGGGNPANPPRPGVNHACFTIDNFEPNRVMRTLIANGLEPIEYGNPALIKPNTCRVRLRQKSNNGGGPTSPYGTPELYFNDPDNIPVQIQDVKYCGGRGALGEICP
jgi:catechol 2,3-dioxygenase-like lactoylglutathione lyase family enzyme